MTIMKYKPFAEFDDIGSGLRLFQDTVNRMLTEPAARPVDPGGRYLRDRERTSAEGGPTRCRDERHRYPIGERDAQPARRAEISRTKPKKADRTALSALMADLPAISRCPTR